MTTPMAVYGEIAGRYGVDATDATEVDEFFLKVVPALPPHEREGILNELLAASASPRDVHVTVAELPLTIPLLPLDEEGRQGAGTRQTRSPSRLELIEDRRARFDSIYRKYYSRIVQFYIRAFRFAPEDAEELAQEAFIRFYGAMDDYRGDAEWAFFETTARNVAYNRVRRSNTQRRAARTIDIDELPPSDVPAAAEPDYAAREQQALLRKSLHDAIAGLPDGHRQCLQLWLDGFSYNEIASVLRVTASVAKSRLYEARRRLREQLGEHGELAADTE